MTLASAIPVVAIVSAHERAAVSAAVERLSAWLTTPRGAPWPLTCAFPDADVPEAIGAAPRLLLLSLSPDAERPGEAWETARARLEARVSALSAKPEQTVFILTVFRHVAEDLPAARRVEILLRIRRLNLLAVELSHRFGVRVIDIDRACADIGAQVLSTDHRLQGEGGRRIAAGCIARTLLDAGLEAWIPGSLQTQAEAKSIEALASERPSRPVGPEIGALAVSAGDRVQLAKMALSIDRRAALLVRGLLTGKVPVVVAWQALARDVARRGPAHTLRAGLRAAAQLGGGSLRLRSARR